MCNIARDSTAADAALDGAVDRLLDVCATALSRNHVLYCRKLLARLEECAKLGG